MITRYTYGNTVWIDLNRPEQDEVQAIVDEFDINKAVAKELVSPSLKSRAELYKKYIYLILHFPAFKHSHGQNTKQEIDFIIGKDFLITARYDTIDAMDKFAKEVEVKSILDRGFNEERTGAMFFGILEEIYQSLLNELDYIDTWTTKIEDKIFSGNEREMVMALSDVSRNLLNFKKSTDFHKEVLTTLDTLGKKIFDEHFSYHVHKSIGEYLKVENSLKNAMDFVSELRQTNDSLLSTKENEIMKTLTIMAFTTFPLTLMAAMFSMDTKFTPIVGHPNDFWIILGIMFGATVLFFIFFKYKKWF